MVKTSQIVREETHFCHYMGYTFPVPDRGSEEGAGTCARDRRVLQQLALNVHVKHSYLTWPTLFD